MEVFEGSFELFFDHFPDKKYDLIVSNPPFFTRSLKPEKQSRQLARHADDGFFERLLKGSAAHLSVGGSLTFIIPCSDTAKLTAQARANRLYLKTCTEIRSFRHSAAHRHILNFVLADGDTLTRSFVIYDGEKQYSDGYRILLADFLTIF